MQDFTFIDLFSGIGGFRLALEKLGGKCVAFSEIDKQAVDTYQKNFNTSDEIKLGDITKQKNFPNADVIVGGVPCQSWSIAGKNRGFDDERGQLWFDSIRAVGQVRPKVFIFENVKGLGDPRNSESLKLILSKFEALNYKVYHKVLNAFDFGLPQNRERIFLVGLRNDLSKASEFIFPDSKIVKPKLYEFFDKLQLNETHLKTKKFEAKELYGSDKVPASRNKFQKDDELNNFFIFCDTRNGHTTIHSWDLIETTEFEKLVCMTFLKNRRKSIYGEQDGNPISFVQLKKLLPELKLKTLENLVEKNILKTTATGKFDLVNSKNSSGINDIYRVYLPESDIFSTLTATGTKDFIATKSIPKISPNLYKEHFIKNIIQKGNFRQITSREAARLQGFPESYKVHSSYRYAIKQFGNAVPVNVVESLMSKVIEITALKVKKSYTPAIKRQLEFEL